MKKNSLKDYLIDSALSRDDRTAITFLRGGELESIRSYFELNRDSNQMANAFCHLGVEKGDRVILFMQKSLAFVIAHIALQKIGAIAVPLNPGFKTSEMEYLLQDAEPKLVLSDPDKAEMIDSIDPRIEMLPIDTHKPFQSLDFFRTVSELPPEVNIKPEDAALIIYTSGTTGKPKGAVLTHRNLIQDAENIIKIWEINQSDVLCHALPLFHVHGLCFALHTALLSGAHVLMLDQFDPYQVTEALVSSEGPNSCTIFMAVPSMYAKLMAHIDHKKYDFRHIRLWTSGSAPLLAQDFKRIKAILGKEPVEREGMSETGMNFSNPLKGLRKPGSIGLPLPGLKVRIVNPDTLMDVASGQTGEIWLRGPAITPGYWRKPLETEEAFEQGWFRTGDLGYVDGDGYYYLTDRIKHIIISGGENISPKEIEACINGIEGVAESSVVGIPDEKWGEKVVAAVVAEPDFRLSQDDIRSYCKENLHDWKCPKEVVFLEELPRNTMGKVLKNVLRGLF
jgi:malonyl-CoA/methylmalonyl-CoA synthetase